ncbi:MAG: hypothetical protein ACXVJB_01425 [Mucilaginibacter sp.]|jgi:hypothetical protein
MSKDKGSKEKKKAPAEGGKKGQSDYQASKSSSRVEIVSKGKK